MRVYMYDKSSPGILSTRDKEAAIALQRIFPMMQTDFTVLNISWTIVCLKRLLYFTSLPTVKVWESVLYGSYHQVMLAKRASWHGRLEDASILESRNAHLSSESQAGRLGWPK